MSDDKIQYDVHDYSPVNKYIEDQARLKRSASTWRYAKATALILVAAGILTVLLAWAYYLYKKPHRLVSLSEIEDRILSNEERSGINISLAELTLSLKYSSKLFLG